MKVLFVVISFLFFNSELLNSARELYKEAAFNPTKIEALNHLLETVTLEDQAPLVAYKGAGLVLKSKSAKSIKEKKKIFVEGVSLVEKAANKEPKSIEVRFIRLTIQENTPAFLGYKNNIENDKLFILDNFKSIKSKNLLQAVKMYVEQQSKLFSVSEKATILAYK